MNGTFRRQIRISQVPMNSRRCLLLVAIAASATALAAAPFQIVGGRPVKPGEMPFMAAIAHRQTSNYFCGGTAIGSRWILTAAHCLVGPDGGAIEPGALMVTVGALKLSEAEPGQDFLVTKVMLHEKYDPESQAHDIALLELDRPWAGPVAQLPPAAPDDSFYRSGTTAGFGATAEGRQPRQIKRKDGRSILAASDILLAANVAISSRAACRERYASLPEDERLPVTEAHICAGEPGATRDSCQGDSGGPLLTGSEKKIIQLGIVSFGNGCARKGFPGVYTRVGAYVQWLRQRMGEAGSGSSKAT